jgi:hypothetical protein
MREPSTGNGLRLPRDVGIPESVAQTIESRWNTISVVDARLKAVGFHDNDMPNIECPVVTTEMLVTPDVKEYTTVFSAQLRWYNYVTRLLADVRAVILQLKNEMDDISASKRSGFRALNEHKAKADKISPTEMEDLILQDPHYQELRLQHQQLEQQRIKLDAWADSLDRNLKTVSRQIENRRTENLGSTREGNMAGDSSRRGSWEPRRPG